MAAIIIGIIVWLPSIILATVIGLLLRKTGTGLVLGLLYGPLGVLIMLFMLHSDRHQPTAREMMTKAEVEAEAAKELWRRRQGPENKPGDRIRQLLDNLLNSRETK